MSVAKSLQEFKETEGGESFRLQHSKCLKVELAGEEIQAKLGSMVAYQGDVDFEHAGSGGLTRMAKKAMTGEGAALMKIKGKGEVFLADLAQDIQLLKLDNEAITVNGANLLAFDADIDWDIKKVEGASGMLSGGLYNTHLEGTGYVAVVSDGTPVLLEVDGNETYADPQAAITWSEGVEDRDQDQRLDEEPDRPRLGRELPDELLGQGLAPDPALRGPRRGALAGRRRRWRRRRRARQDPERLSRAQVRSQRCLRARDCGQTLATPGPLLRSEVGGTCRWRLRSCPQPCRQRIAVAGPRSRPARSRSRWRSASRS